MKLTSPGTHLNAGSVDYAMNKTKFHKSVIKQCGSIELVVAGLLAALLVVLALPLFLDPPADFKEKDAEIQHSDEVDS